MAVRSASAATGTVPPPAPPGFSPESFFEGVHWHQRWEIFRGVCVPGPNPLDLVCDACQLPADLSGQRVLDVGAWNGCFSFECERRGAEEVVAFSLEDPVESGFTRLKELLGSRVQYVSGSVYDLSRRDLGTFDLILFFGVLYHLRHPLLAIDRLRGVSRGDVLIETHVIDEQKWVRPSDASFADEGMALRSTPIWRQYQEFELHPQDASNWFGPNVAAVLEAFESAGFDIAHLRSWGDRAAFRARAATIPKRLLQGSYEAFPANRGWCATA
jgi:tRNA (mo5U34)-methyltransferase